MDTDDFVRAGLLDPGDADRARRLALLDFLAEHGVGIDEMVAADHDGRLPIAAAERIIRGGDERLTLTEACQRAGVPEDVVVRTGSPMASRIPATRRSSPKPTWGCSRSSPSRRKCSVRTRSSSWPACSDRPWPASPRPSWRRSLLPLRRRSCSAAAVARASSRSSRRIALSMWWRWSTSSTAATRWQQSRDLDVSGTRVRDSVCSRLRRRWPSASPT